MNKLQAIQYAIECVINAKTDSLKYDAESFITLQLLFRLYDEAESLDKDYLKVSEIS